MPHIHNYIIVLAFGAISLITGILNKNWFGWMGVNTATGKFFLSKDTNRIVNIVVGILLLVLGIMLFLNHYHFLPHIV
jgi:threonine/homoserine/homoserine lactone efflux protein